MNPPEKHSILKTIDLDIGYSNKTAKTIITEAINIEVHEGELVAVIGVNGVGKSTFLRTLSGVQDALKGKVLVKNEQIQQIDSLELASLVSLVLTEQPISKNLSVFELVALGRQPYTNWIGRLSKNDLRQIKKSLQNVGIEDLQNKKCYELSDGQLQKVLIARAIAQNTPLVILDEPTTHLDLYHKAYVLKLLKKLTRKTNKAIVFASHEINLAIQLCDKIILMQNKKVTTGSPKELLESGAFSTVFPEGLIVFDKASASFKINP
ncbi:iron complex transport system ATP-binding protein [Salegentibacter salinarum]|uniref:ABC transporter ATP-binding protein n=1 Tax=Salegentibacter salinarum TaxID=447422 RepID=UPI0009D24D83|nr:ABC transporter ATP-binding protein [Salegentibacter salinarum]SKB53296.1 iron complex transport system ATP-binding protein [Salegentibacter salinarum]